mgnify:CR=1 FL=1
MLRADALQLACDAAWIGGERSEAERAAAELERAAEEMPSARLAADARLARALVAFDAIDPTLLEELAQLTDRAPLAARRAALLLGDRNAHGDRIDERVIEAATRAWGGARWERVSSDGWGLDSATMSVWLPGGRNVSLRTRKRDWRILSTLAKHGGRATKEQLVLGVWKAGSYHPLRDDKRLQIAIRRLRILIEDDPSKPTRIVTVEDGYAFGDRASR